MKIHKALNALKLKKDSGIIKVGLNSIWLILDRLIRMGVGLVIGVWIARYFGPELFGTWNYALAFVGLFSTLATLGIDGIVVRDLTLHQEKTYRYLGSTLGLRLISGFASALLCLLTAYFFENDDHLSFMLIAILTVTLLLQVFDTIDLYFQSVVKSYYTVFSKGLSFLLISFLKIGLLYLSSSVLYFAIANVIELVFSSIFLIISLRNVKIKFLNLKWDGTVAKKLTTEGWPLIIAGILVMIYLKIDQIMLKQMVNEKSVGIYSAAIRLSEIWYFIPMVISSSLLPLLIKQRKISKERYKLTLKRIYSLFLWMALLIAIFVNFVSDYVITLLYGIEYLAASKVLSIHIWAGVFVFLGVASSQYLVAENIVKISLYRTLFGTISNLILNFIFIPKYHEIGAAYATLISYFISTFSLIFFKQAREQCKLMFMALLPSKRLFSRE